MGHEAYVIELAKYDIADSLGYYSDEYIDWDEVKKFTFKEHLDSISDEEKQVYMNEYNTSDEEELIEQVLYDPKHF